MDAPRPLPEPKVEAELAQAITELDWAADPVSGPLRLIQERLALDEAQALKCSLAFRPAILSSAVPTDLPTTCSKVARSCRL